MKLRKGIALLVTVGMILLLTACGGMKETADIPPSGPGSAETDAGGGAGEKADQAEEPDAGKAEEGKADNTEEKPQKEKKGKGTKVATNGSIEETVLLEEEGIKITATGLSYSDYDVRLNLTIENNTEQKLSFTNNIYGYNCNSVNGYMVNEGYLSADVAAGKKKNDSISFSYNELLLYGITEIADIQVWFTVKNDEYDTVCEGTGQVQTSLAENYDYGADTLKSMLESKAWEKLADCSIDYYSGEEVHNQDGIRIISQALITNRDDEKIALVEVINDLPETIYGDIRDVYLNGLLVTQGTWSRKAIAPGKRCIIEILPESMLGKAKWERFGIVELGNITFALDVKDEEDDEIYEPLEVSMEISREAMPIDDSGQELYNEEDMRIIAKGLQKEDSDSYLYMLFLIENQSSDVRSVNVGYGSVSINGYMIDNSYMWTDVPAGKCAVLEVHILERDLEENNISGIEDITEVELTFEIKEEYDEIASPMITIQY